MSLTYKNSEVLHLASDDKEIAVISIGYGEIKEWLDETSQDIMKR